MSLFVRVVEWDFIASQQKIQKNDKKYPKSVDTQNGVSVGAKKKAEKLTKNTGNTRE